MKHLRHDVAAVKDDKKRGLSLTRLEGEGVQVKHGGEEMTVSVSKVVGGRVRIRFEGPLSFGLMRTEVAAQIGSGGGGVAGDGGGGGGQHGLSPG